MDTEFLCVRCAGCRKTCCQTSEIFITLDDQSRIAAHAGRADFWEYREPTEPVYLAQDDDPLWRDVVIRADGTRRVLVRKANGDCTFLGSHGCTLPIDVRPLVCRIYPYDFTAQGILPTLANGCPVELIPPGQDLIGALDMRFIEAYRWHKQLYEELRAEQEQMALSGQHAPVECGSPKG